MIKLIYTLFNPAQVNAQGIIDNGIPGCDFGSGQLSASCVPNFIAHVIQWMAGFLGAAFLIIIIWAGYELALGGLTGSGKDAGKQRLIFGIIGFLVSVLSFAIIDFVISTLAA